MLFELQTVPVGAPTLHKTLSYVERKGVCLECTVQRLGLDFEMVYIIKELFACFGDSISRIKPVGLWHLFSGVLSYVLSAP